jgi:hypothetical protein
VVVGDIALEVDRAGSFVRDGPHSDHDIGPMEADNPQRADQIDPVVNTDDSDEAHLSVAESSGQTLAPMTVLAGDDRYF